MPHRRAWPRRRQAGRFDALEGIYGQPWRPLLSWCESIVNGCLFIAGNVDRGRSISFAVWPTVEICCEDDNSSAKYKLPEIISTALEPELLRCLRSR
jgi:hypothetical protein